MAVIAVQSPLESLQALELDVRAYSEDCLISCLEVCFKGSLSACSWSACQIKALELDLSDAYFSRS